MGLGDEAASFWVHFYLHTFLMVLGDSLPDLGRAELCFLRSLLAACRPRTGLGFTPSAGLHRIDQPASPSRGHSGAHGITHRPSVAPIKCMLPDTWLSASCLPWRLPPAVPAWISLWGYCSYPQDLFIILCTPPFQIHSLFADSYVSKTQT